MTLQAINFAIDVSSWGRGLATAQPAKNEPVAVLPCAFCGVRSGKWQMSAVGAAADAKVRSACPLCALPQHLERPRIDEEATLVWLPEVSQQAITALIRSLHLQLRALGEALPASSTFRKRGPQLRGLHYARAILAERSGAAESRLGTSLPSALGHSLLELSPAGASRQGQLLGGLRLLPLGRFFEGGKDVYPEIVDQWSHGSMVPSPLAQTERKRSLFGKRID